MSGNFDWDDSAIARLRALWTEDLPTAEIGRRLGVSKCAIVGKAHRLDLPARPSPIRREGIGGAGVVRPMRASPRPIASARAVRPAAPPRAARLSAAPVRPQPASAPEVRLTRPDAPRAVESPPLIVYAPGGRGCEAVLQPFKPGMDPRDVYCGKPRRDRLCSYCLVHAAVFLTRHVTRASTVVATLAAAE